ncbi:hypothetical protein D3C87_80650 [compost metagenome]
MANFKFDTTTQMIDFLFNAKSSNDIDSAFDKWETTYISLKTATGLEMALNTRVLDTGSGNEYLIWKKIKSMVKIFLDQNNNSGMSIDIRLVCPQSIKSTIDTNNSFSSFRLSLYSGSGIIIATSTTIENVTPTPIEPITAWNTMIESIFTTWQTEYNKQFQ